MFGCGRQYCEDHHGSTVVYAREQYKTYTCEECQHRVQYIYLKLAAAILAIIIFLVCFVLIIVYGAMGTTGTYSHTYTNIQ